MPVTSTSVEAAWSAKEGASRWMPAVCSLEIGPASSIGSPITFMMRPRVAGPTGTVIGPPVSVTAWRAGQALGGVHGDAAHRVLAEVLGDLQHEAEGLAGALVGVLWSPARSGCRAACRRTRRRPRRRSPGRCGPSRSRARRREWRQPSWRGGPWRGRRERCRSLAFRLSVTQSHRPLYCVLDGDETLPVGRIQSADLATGHLKQSTNWVFAPFAAKNKITAITSVMTATTNQTEMSLDSGPKRDPATAMKKKGRDCG